MFKINKQYFRGIAIEIRAKHNHWQWRMVIQPPAIEVKRYSNNVNRAFLRWQGSVLFHFTRKLHLNSDI